MTSMAAAIRAFSDELRSCTTALPEVAPEQGRYVLRPKELSRSRDELVLPLLDKLDALAEDHVSARTLQRDLRRVLQSPIRTKDPRKNLATYYRLIENRGFYNRPPADTPLMHARNDLLLEPQDDYADRDPFSAESLHTLERCYEIAQRLDTDLRASEPGSDQKRVADCLDRVRPVATLNDRAAHVKDGSPRPLVKFATDGHDTNDFSASNEADNYFRRQGTDTWVVRFQGGEQFVLSALKGAAVLECLLREPSKQISAVQLCRVLDGSPPARAERGFDEQRDTGGSPGMDVADERAIREYKRALEVLESTRAAAAESGDIERVESTDVEIAKINRAIREAQDARGLHRRFRDEREKARSRISGLLKTLLKRIRETNPALADHLRRPTLTLGKNCTYNPDPPVDWQL